MKVRRHSEFYNFIGCKESGVTFRWGKNLDDDPLYAPWPELVDISISNHCTRECSHCYRDSKDNRSFMRTTDYEYILECLNHPRWGNVFQVALGGGEPLEHPDFIDIIEITDSFGVIPNFTTNGIHLNEKIIESIRGKVGAVAVSINCMEEFNRSQLNPLLESGIKTNIHFILSKNSIGQAVEILNGVYDELLSGLNGIIFLTYKPAGRAHQRDCLSWDCNLKEFVKLIDNYTGTIRIGFDACFVPILLHLTNTDVKFIDPCECAFFSVYIDENLNVKPCSFTNTQHHTFNLRENSFQTIWEEKFDVYRRSSINQCARICKNTNNCRGGCPFFEEINLCYTSSKQEQIEL
jgi:radical SAM protein with 4Fe4S-binding SPASM domain